jgi:hypothetical protein
MEPIPEFDPTQIPANWWQRADTVETLIKWFRWHVVGLFVKGHSGKDHPARLYSGFLVIFKEQLVWLTAGHVIDQVDEALNTPGFVVDEMRWMDTYTDTVEGIHSPAPVHYIPPRMMSWTKEGIDVGCIIVLGLDRVSLESNPNLHPLRLSSANALEGPPPDGYFVIGYPTALITHTVTPTSPNIATHSFAGSLACLPVNRVDPPDDPNRNEFWNRSYSIYAELLSFADRPNAVIPDIPGMSGGPLFSITWMPNGNMNYRIRGIQSSWLESARVICAERMDIVIGILETLL